MLNRRYWYIYPLLYQYLFLYSHYKFQEIFFINFFVHMTYIKIYKF